MYEVTRKDIKKVWGHKLFQQGLQFCIEDSFNPKANEFKNNQKILKLSQKLDEIPIEQRSEYLKKYPLPYFSYHENPNDHTYNSIPYKNAVKENKMLEDLIESATDIYEPSWYCYYHECHTVAVFILYPLIKLLYPQQKIYLYTGDHVFLMNNVLSKFKNIKKFPLMQNLDETCIIDLISQCAKEQLKEVFPLFEDLKMKSLEEWLGEYPRVRTPSGYEEYQKRIQEMTQEIWENRIFDIDNQVPEHKIGSWYIKIFKNNATDDRTSHNIEKQRTWFNEILKL